MRDQYAGDISDVLKFAFLRALARTDRTLGIAWYYVPGNDGRPDGRHLEWRDEPAWQQLDAVLCAGLDTLSQRSIAALEGAAIWPEGKMFHRDPMPTRAERSVWGRRKRDALDGADIVFLDPDNGVGKETKKHATFLEIRQLRKSERAIVFITFPGRSMKHDDLVQQLHKRLETETSSKNIVTLRTSVLVPTAMGKYVPRLRWFTVVDADNELISRAQAFAKALKKVPRVKAELYGGISEATSVLREQPVELVG